MEDSSMFLVKRGSLAEGVLNRIDPESPWAVLAITEAELKSLDVDCVQIANIWK